MTIDNNAIFGYGFIIKNINYKEEDIESIIKYCEDEKIDYIHDCYWSEYEIFIGYTKNKVQNGINTYSKNNSWNSDKDKLPSSRSVNFEIFEKEFNKVHEAYFDICEHNEDKPRWILFTYNS